MKETKSTKILANIEELKRELENEVHKEDFLREFKSIKNVHSATCGKVPKTNFLDEIGKFAEAFTVL